MEWKKFDLHHHTYEDGGSRISGLSNFKEIIDKFNENNGSLIAITNHNKISINSVEKYEKYIKEKKYDINVLYGVEVSFDLETTKNHKDGKVKKQFGDICFIFDITKEEAIKLNAEIFDDKNIYNPEKISIYENLFKLINELRKKEVNFIVMPHFHKGSDEIDFDRVNKKEYFNLITLFDLLESKYVKDFDKKSVDRAIEEIEKINGNRKSFIFGTDAQDISDFIRNLKEKVPWVYSENNFKGLKKIIRFNKTRVIYGDKPDSTDRYIKSIKIDNETIKLDRGLNCIIGRRGTGKTKFLKILINNLKERSNDIKFNNELTSFDDVEYMEQNQLANSISDMMEAMYEENALDKMNQINKSRFGSINLPINDFKDGINTLSKKFSNGLIASYNIEKKAIDTRYFSEFQKLLNSFKSIQNMKLKELLNKILKDTELLKKFIDDNINLSYWTKTEIKKIISELNKMSDSQEAKEINKISDINTFLELINIKESGTENDKYSADYELSFNEIIKATHKINTSINNVKKSIVHVLKYMESYKKEARHIQENDQEKFGIIGKNYLKIKDETQFIDFLSSFLQLKYKKIKNLQDNKIIDLLKWEESGRKSNSIVDFFEIEYRKFIGDTPLDNLSIGQQHEIFLKNKLRESKNILILDQPDDDLDALTIKEQIIKRIIKWNVSKQIIIVSHDPKIVINSDSKKIILANYNGDKEFGKKNYRNIDYVDLRKGIYKILDAKKEYPFIRFKQYGGRDGN